LVFSSISRIFVRHVFNVYQQDSIHIHQDLGPHFIRIHSCVFWLFFTSTTRAPL